MTDVRATRLQVLYDCYAVQSRRNLTDYHPGRWATVGEEIARDGFVTDARIDTFSMEWDAMQWLADGLLDGYVPEALYDLDTGDRINLHVGTPAVTRSEDQAIYENPLEGK